MHTPLRSRTLRSPLIAGAVAVVGACVVALPVGTAGSLPSITPPATAEVTLAALQSPLAAVFDTLAVATNYLSNATDNPQSSDNWPFAGFGTTFGVPPTNYPLLPAALSAPELGGYSSVGLIPQIIDDALPILSQLGYNGSDYLDVTGEAVFSAGSALLQGVWSAVGDLVVLDIPGAVATLIGSVSTAGTLLLEAGTYVLSNVIARAQAVLATVVGALPRVIGGTVAQAQAVMAASIAFVGDTVAALGSGDIEGAWNAAVNGLLGPSGVPGTIVNLTVGAGVQTGPIVTPDAAGVTAAFAPSIRTEVQAGVKAITGALQTVPAATAARPVAGSAAAVRSAAADAAPAADAGPADGSAGGDSDDSSADSSAAGESRGAATAQHPTKQIATRGTATRATAGS